MTVMNTRQEQAAALRARLDEMNRIAEACAARTIKRAERVLKREHDAPTRRALIDAIKKFRRVIGESHTAAPSPVALPMDGPVNARRVVSQPANPGAP